MPVSTSANIIPRSYTGRDFDTAVASLVQFIKTTRPDVWSDFLQSNLGSAMIDLMAYTLDVASFAQDASVLETFLATCKRYESALFFARSVGYVPRPYTAATATLRSSTMPDSVLAYGGTVAAGAAIQGRNGLSYEVLEDVTIAPGNGIIRLNVQEGRSYSEPFVSQSIKNATVVTSQTKIADGSWSVYVGSVSSTNLWTQVDSVLVAASGAKVYDVSFDLDGRLIVRFGDGLAGALPDQPGTIQYRTCNGSLGNAPARSLSGQLPVILQAPGSGSVQVQFENYEASVVGAGSSAMSTGDYLGPVAANATQSFVLNNSPIQPGTLSVTMNLAGGQVISLRDDAAGALTVVSSNAVQTLTSGTVIYSSGIISLLFNISAGSFAAGGSVLADYYYVTTGDPTQVTIVGAATGGADRETIDDMRNSIPAFIRSSNRLVTLADYRDALSNIAGVALAEASVLSSGYTGNVVRLFIWGEETVTISSTEPGGASGAASYTRYSQVSDTVANRVQGVVRQKSLLTVGSLVLRPEMLWVDLYFGNIKYDKRLNAQDVRESIMSAIALYFQKASGFAILISEIYATIRAARGVQSFELLRAATGTRSIDGVAEGQGATTAGVVASGTLLNTYVTPGTAIIIIQQALTQIVCQDNAAGEFTIVNGSSQTIVNSSIDYTTGAWSIEFGSVLSGGYPITAQYADVQNDYRHTQLVEIGGDSTSGDFWPPPGNVVSSPIATPPFTDGRPGSYQSSSVAKYAPIQDIIIQQIVSNSRYFDDTYFFNDEILYDSVDLDLSVVRAINLRKVAFTLVPN
jgi:hypothetical protein